MYSPQSSGWRTAPVSVLRADIGDSALFVVLSNLSLLSRSIAACHRSKAIVTEYRFLSLKEARQWVGMMLQVVPGSKFLLNPTERSWAKIQGRFERVSKPYMRISSNKARKVRCTSVPNPYPSVF